MKIRPGAASALALLLALFISSDARGGPHHELVEANTAFAFDLFGQLKSQPGNLFFSPLGVSATLAVAYAGARGETERQMSNILRFANRSDVHFDFGLFQRQLLWAGGQYGGELDLATVAWSQIDYPFRSAFFDTASNSYHAFVKQTDFTTEAASAARQINAWVAQQTKNKIQTVVAPEKIDPSTRLLLAGAVYFKGVWDIPFDKSRTRMEPFHITSTSDTNAPLMHNVMSAEYFEDDDLQAVILPYNGIMDMIVLLPRAPDGLDAMEGRLSPAFFTNVLAQMTPRDVDVSLPEFKVESRFQLNSALARMGMADAFSQQADFSGIDGNTNLYISDVSHQAWCEVNEQGTEAAAATTSSLEAKGMGTPPPPLIFRADHPFDFLICDAVSSSILFLGRVANPSF